MIKKILCVMIGMILAVAILIGCLGQDQNQYISDMLGVDVSQGTVLDSRDSHGSFHNDGTLAVMISFTREQADRLLSQFQDKSGWHPFPLTENLTTALYGKTTPNYARAPLIQDDAAGTLPVPEINHGWYYFYDRYSEAENPLDDSRLFSRYSYNCTFAVFDSDTLTLYFFEIDT